MASPRTKPNRFTLHHFRLEGDLPSTVRWAVWDHQLNTYAYHASDHTDALATRDLLREFASGAKTTVEFVAAMETRSRLQLPQILRTVQPPAPSMTDEFTSRVLNAQAEAWSAASANVAPSAPTVPTFPDGGSLVLPDTAGLRPATNYRCCPAMTPQTLRETGTCGEGCCTDYRCTACGATFRYEWPD